MAQKLTEPWQCCDECSRRAYFGSPFFDGMWLGALVAALPVTMLAAFLC